MIFNTINICSCQHRVLVSTLHVIVVNTDPATASPSSILLSCISFLTSQTMYMICLLQFLPIGLSLFCDH